MKSFITARGASLNGTLDCTTVAVEELATAQDLGLFPSPATDAIQVRLPAGWSMSEVRMFDAVGRAVPISTSARAVDLAGLAPGMYVLRAAREGQVLSARFQKL